jgi:hypothetical protein
MVSDMSFTNLKNEKTSMAIQWVQLAIDEAMTSLDAGSFCEIEPDTERLVDWCRRYIEFHHDIVSLQGEEKSDE